MSDSEEDFMSDAFLAKVAPPTKGASSSSGGTLTYQERRRRDVAASAAKNKANAQRPYREREEEARREGMDTNLFQKELDSETGPSKAMLIMTKMGYKVGDGLGPKKEAVTSTEKRDGPVDDDDEAAQMQGGIGSNKRRKVDEEAEAQLVVEEQAAASSSTLAGRPTQQRFEPLAVSLWAGRKGVGTKQTYRPPPSQAASTETTSKAPDVDAYRSQAQQQYLEKKAEGQINSARKTVVELDERDDRGFSILHLNPSQISSFPAPLLAHLQGVPPPRPIASYETSSNLASAEVLRRQMAMDKLQPLGSGGVGNEDEDEVGGGGGLAALKKGREEQREDEKSAVASAEVSDTEDWELLGEEAAKFIALPATQRLGLTLNYLREEFAYCFFCGFSYSSHEALDAECPGTNEDDHD